MEPFVWTRLLFRKGGPGFLLCFFKEIFQSLVFSDLFAHFMNSSQYMLLTGNLCKVSPCLRPLTAGIGWLPLTPVTLSAEREGLEMK